MVSGHNLSAMLREVAISERNEIVSSLSEIDGPNCALLLIEAARVMDYENVQMNFREEKLSQLNYPSFDILTRGWNPLAAFLLPRISEMNGFPMRESTPETRSSIRSILYAFGKCAILDKAADMAYQGMLTGEYIEGVLNLNTRIDECGDHFLDRFESSKLDRVLNEAGTKKALSEKYTMPPEQVDSKISELVFPFDTGYGIMVGYDALPELDDHFIALVAEKTLTWREEAGLHPNVKTSSLDGAEVAVVTMFLISIYLKHIWFVGVGRKQIEKCNYAMSLTIWKKPEDLIESISSYFGISKEKVEKALKSLLISKKDAGYFDKVSNPFMPLLLEISEGYWLAPISGIFKNPFQTIRMLNEYRTPSIDSSFRVHREDWMRSDLYYLFQGNRYQLVNTSTRLKRNNLTITDIDAAILDKMTGELAIFQLKWQDFETSNLKQIRSKAKNFVEQVDAWSKQTIDWINEFGIAELCQCLRLKIPKGSAPPKVLLFAIGRTSARFASYGYERKEDDTVASTWNQFIRIRHEVGPAETVFLEMHRRIKAERSQHFHSEPVPFNFQVNGSMFRFHDMWLKYPA